MDIVLAPKNVNIYEYTLNIARKARKLCCKYQNISHSEAISFILSNNINQLYSINNQRKLLRYKRSGSAAKDYLIRIIDQDVKNSVEYSLVEYRKTKHLIYYYINVYDEFRKARIRIITNMLLDLTND